MKRDKYFQRQEQLIKAVEDNSQDLDNHLVLAKFYFVNQYYLEAIAIYKKLLEYYPREINVLYNLAIAYQADNQLNKAREIYLKILEIEPDNKGARTGLERITTFK